MPGETTYGEYSYSFGLFGSGSMTFTAVETANGTLTANTVLTITLGSGATAIRYSDISVTNESGATPASIYATTDGSVPTVGGEDCEEIEAGQTVLLGNSASLWTQGLLNVPKGSLDPTTGVPETITPMGYALNGSVSSVGTTVKLISAQAVGYTVTGE